MLNRLFLSKLNTHSPFIPAPLSSHQMMFYVLFFIHLLGISAVSHLLPVRHSIDEPKQRPELIRREIALAHVDHEATVEKAARANHPLMNVSRLEEEVSAVGRFRRSQF